MDTGDRDANRGGKQVPWGDGVLDAYLDGELDEMEREAVLTSMRNLQGFPFVAKAIEDGTLTLHGTWLDIAEGSLHVYSEDGGFQPV